MPFWRDDPDLPYRVTLEKWGFPMAHVSAITADVMASKNSKSVRFSDRLQFALIRSILGVLFALPYRRRVRFLGWVMQHVIAPVAGYNRRSKENLEMIAPELSSEERSRMVGRVANNIGRTLAELFSAQDFVDHVGGTELSGPGLSQMQEAKAAGRPIIVISGHFGNYDVVRSALIRHGYHVGGLYRRMDNPLFHDFYVDRISAIGTPLFQRGRQGLGQMVRHLKSGGTLAALIDVRAGNGAPLTYFGKRAWTALSMAELALKYDALVVPCYAVRQPDGLTFKTSVEEPIPHTDPETMTQALNDSLEAQVRENMEQWFWIHRRWKDVPNAVVQEEA